MVAEPTTPWRNRICGHGEEIPDQLLANPRNWRIHPKAQQDALSGVLDEVGWVQDVIVNQQTGFVVDGHLRVFLAISRGEPKIPVVYVDLTPEEEGLILATLDPLAGMAVAAKDALEALLADVSPAGAAVKGLLEDVAKGAGLNGAKEGLTDPDAVPEAVEAVAKRGDVWVCGDHRVMCGDSTEEADVARLMAGEKADCVFTDPPYGISYQSRVDEKRRKPWGGMEGDDLRGAELQALLMAIPQTEPRYICSQWESLPDLWTTHGKPRNIIIWDKRWVGLGKGYRRQHELVAFYGKLNTTTETDVWALDRAEDYEHPTQKPVMLVERALRNSSISGNLVLDPFLGSGTTMIAAERLGRRCYGMEIEPRYVDVAVRRWEDFTGRKAVRDG